MTFKNEYIPPIEQETSGFLKTARETLRTGYSKFDSWAVDRDREMVLIRMGGGRREIGDYNSDLWGWIDHGGYYVFSMEQVSRVEVSPQEVAITYRLKDFWQGERYSVPSTETIACIKEALHTDGTSYLFNPEAFKRCLLTLIDSATGQEI